MKYPLHDIELIERYFDNELSAEEKRHLNDRLKNDFEFQKLFDQEKLLIRAIRVEAASRDLDYLQKLEASLSAKKRTVRRVWYYYAAAACLVVLALAVLIPWQNESPQTLYANYFQPHPNVFEPVVRGGSENSPRAQAFQAYERNDYQRAATLFSALLKENSDPGMLMLLGNSNLILGETELAKENFSELINRFDALDTAGKWYLGLCFLKTGETVRASALFREVSGSNSQYGVKARNLLQDLD